MTKEEVKEYIDNYISHIISMTEYGNWFADEIKSLVENAIEECDKVLYSYHYATTKKVCNNCKREIDVILKDLEEEITSLIEKEVMKLSEEEKEWLEEYVAGPLGLSFSYSDKASKLLLLIPIASAGIVGQYGNTLAERLRTIYNQEIMSSYVSGVPFDELDYEARFNTFYRGLEADSETLGESLATQYDRIIYTANDEKINKYMWLAILDGRTCLVCADLDHTVYSKIEDVPIYAKHNRCRCSVMIINDEIEKFVPESYEQWFENQSPKEKYQILGKKRFELYESGMKIKNFVNNGKITPLKDLKK